METRLPPKQKIVGSTPTEIVLYHAIKCLFIKCLFIFYIPYNTSAPFTRLIFSLCILILKARVAEWSKAAV